MSAWSEAVWIVQKLQKNFDFTQQISSYTIHLNELNGRVNSLNTDVRNLNQALEQQKEQVDLTASVIRAKSNDGVPDSEANYTKGTIWLVLQ